MSKGVLCPYCGPHNGHSNGVEMELYAYDGLTGFGYHYHCPSCHSSSPLMHDKKTARTAALRRFDPGVEQIKWERDTAIKQLHDDYGVGLGQKKPMQKPMTLEEVRQMCTAYHGDGQGKPVFVEYQRIPHNSSWGLVDCERAEAICVATTWDDAHYFELRTEMYGASWRCWRTCPTNDERRAARWENTQWTS